MIVPINLIGLIAFITNALYLVYLISSLLLRLTPFIKMLKLTPRKYYQLMREIEKTSHSALQIFDPEVNVLTLPYNYLKSTCHEIIGRHQST